MRGWHLLLALALLPPLLSAEVFKHVRHDHWTGKYDRYFKKYAKHYFGPGFDWHWFKAQGIAESGLRANVSSSAGAKGVMQILPSTFEEIRRDNPHFTSIDDPHWNIAAGIYYDRKLYRRWKAKKVPASERLNFSFASYNAGYAKVTRAYNKAAKKDPTVASWRAVAPYAPSETRQYVRRIRKLMDTR